MRPCVWDGVQKKRTENSDALRDPACLHSEYLLDLPTIWKLGPSLASLIFRVQTRILPSPPLFLFSF